jgi:hypothetical protein
MLRVSLWRLGGLWRIVYVHISVDTPSKQCLGGFFYGERDETKDQQGSKRQEPVSSSNNVSQSWCSRQIKQSET